MSTLETNLIQPSTGTTLTLGASGDTITIPSGATITNSGTASGFGGITEADQWRLNTLQNNSGTNAVLSSNWERNDSTGFGYMGTGMSQSSGVFTFPSTGFYLILWEAKFRLVDGDVAETFIEITTNNSSYSEVAIAASVNNTGSDTDGYNATAHYIVDVTDTSNVKVRFKTGSMANNSYVIGQSGYNQTSATFIRLGDT
jgi:hypothetical protein